MIVDVNCLQEYFISYMSNRYTLLIKINRVLIYMQIQIKFLYALRGLFKYNYKLNFLSTLGQYSSLKDAINL